MEDKPMLTRRDTITASAVLPVLGVPGAVAAKTQDPRKRKPLPITGIVNVKNHGAVGDGVADDTAAIQAAINAALVSGVNSAIPPHIGNSIFGGKVVFPAGSYRTTRPLVARYINGMGAIGLVAEGVVSIYGNFPGYIIDKPDNGFNQIGLVGLQGLSIQNYYGAGGFGSASGTTLTTTKTSGSGWVPGMVVVDNQFGNGLSYGGSTKTRFDGSTTMFVEGDVIGEFLPGQKIVGGGIPDHNTHVIVSQLSGATGKQGSYQLSHPVEVNNSPVQVRSGPYITAQTGPNTYTLSRTENISPRALGGGIGSGALRMCATGNGSIRDCLLQGVNGLDAQNNTFCVQVSNCTFTTGPYPGAVGAYAGQVSFDGCNFIGNNRGLVGNSSTTVRSSRFEVNDHGLIFGLDLVGLHTGTFAVTAIGNTFESNGVTMALIGVNGGFIAGNHATAYPGAVQLPQGGHGDARVGLFLASASGVVFAGNDFGIYCPGAAIDCSNNGNTVANNIVFSGCRATNGHPTGKAWEMPAGNFSSAFKFENSNNPAHEIAYNNLPGVSVFFPVATAGMEYNVSDAHVDAFGAVISAGGGPQHVKGRYNGTNWRVAG
jgi:hypothetical protein